jgi:hypothetical protein
VKRVPGTRHLIQDICANLGGDMCTAKCCFRVEVNCGRTKNCIQAVACIFVVIYAVPLLAGGVALHRIWDSCGGAPVSS